MTVYHSLSHLRRDCESHVAFLTKRRKKRIFGVLRRQLWEIFHDIGRREESKIVEGHLMGDHVPMCLSIPPKYAVVNVVGCIKGKSAIQIARTFGGRRRNFTAKTFGHAFSYFVSTVGLGEDMFRAYIRNQEEEDERYEQMKFGITFAALGRLMLLWRL